MNQKERMLAGLPYKPWLDGLEEERTHCKEVIYDLNHLHPRDRAQIPEILKALFGRTGEDVWLEPPFHCDYGWNIEVGDHFFANYNLTILDVGKVTIGSHVMIAPNVSLYTAGHPLHPASRDSGYEFGAPITIGEGAVIGAGSVVSRDVPPGVLAAGNPCRVIRAITEEDRDYYWRNFRFDVTDY